MTPERLDSLNPRAVSKMFKPDLSAIAEAHAGRHSPGIGQRPSFRALTRSAVLALVTFVILGVTDHLVQRGPDFYSLLSSRPKNAPTELRLEFLQDPAAMVFFAVAFLTPVFCGLQVECIERLVGQSERNLEWMREDVSASRINEVIASSNIWFARLGGPVASIGFLATSIAISLGTFAAIETSGPLASWNPTSLPREKWVDLAEAGWWASSDNRLASATLIAVATYFIYFLFKQLAMGLVFARFSRLALRAGFSPGPNPVFNSDGYYGLLVLRRFMMVTYLSTAAHFALALFVLTVWLPLSVSTLAIATVVVISNAVTVVYPTLTAHAALLDVRRKFVAQLLAGQSELVIEEAKADAIERLWENPTLPFRFRSSITALAVYLLAPVTLALVSTLLPNK